MDIEQLARETRSSIELTRNAKGDYQWVIKAYHETGGEQTALATVSLVDYALRERYLPKPTELEAALEASIEKAGK